MKRNQNELLKKTSRLKWIVLVLITIISGLVVYIVINGQNNADQTLPPSKDSSSESSLELESSTTATSSSNVSITETSNSEDEYKYAVTFPKGQVLYGTLNDTEFVMTTYTDRSDLVVAWTPKMSNQPEGSHLSEMAPLVPTNIDTTTIHVSANGIQKDVNVNTELKISYSNGYPSAEFFSLFNGNDTKIYAYNSNSGHIALAFSPQNADPYQIIVYNVVEFTEKNE